jgi:hypothetical protein
MEQVRIYTLANKEIAAYYFKTHWTKHMKALPKYGFEVKGVWMGNAPEIANQVIVVVAFPDNADVEEMTESYFKSPEFNDIMEGFDRNNFTAIETKIMKSMTSVVFDKTVN